MTDTDHDSLEHVHNKYAHLREIKRRNEQEAQQRAALNDIYDGYYPDEEN